MNLPTHISPVSRKGFTLVELLVVVGILGILAAGLLAAIDPLEQLKKGRDQNKRNIAVEYHNAITRYYATYGTFPWTTAPTGATLNSVSGTTTQTLVTTGELKSSFNAAAGTQVLNNLYLTANATGDVFICFDPESKAVSLDPTSIFTTNQGGTNPTTCPSTTSTTACFFCAR